MGWRDRPNTVTAAAGGAAAEMKLTSVYPASGAFIEVATKLPAGRLYASGKAFIAPIRRDLLGN
jgi:hypothetical protein